MKTHQIKTFLVPVLLSLSLLACKKGHSDQDNTGENDDPIHTFFKAEVKPAASEACFNGAYYRKVITSKDVWLGINGKVVLPSFTLDPNRPNPAHPGQFLDNPSVYMGGNMGGQETDIGLTWEVVKDANGNVSADRRAFRPFCRRAAFIGGQIALYENAPATDEYYWYPGEEVTMSVQIVTDHQLKFIVEGAGKRYETDFECDGYRQGSIGQFKRVDAIDQVNNEGKPVQASNTRVNAAVWKETNLYRMYQNNVVSVPMHSQRFTDVRCPDKNDFSVTATAEDLKIGAETVSISGSGF